MRSEKNTLRRVDAEAPSRNVRRVLLYVDSDLYRELKKCAVSEDKTYSQFAEEAFRSAISSRQQHKHASG